METVLCTKIEHSLHYQQLIVQRRRLSLLLTLLLLLVYCSFMLFIAYAPDWLGHAIAEGHTLTRGVIAGIGVIIISFLLTGIYIYRANNHFDDLLFKLTREVQK